MCFDDSTSDSTVTRRHFVFALRRDEAFIYDVYFSRGLFKPRLIFAHINGPNLAWPAVDIVQPRTRPLIQISLKLV